MGGTKRLMQPTFGPNLRKVINGPRRKSNKPTRFVSMAMRKIEEEVKRAHANMQSFLDNGRNRKDVGDNKAYGHNNKICASTMDNYGTKEQHLDGGKVGQHNPVNQDFSPMVVSSKLGHAVSSDRSVNPTLESLVNPNMEQGFLHRANDDKMPTSQSKNLKAMPGLVLNRKGRPNLDQGQSTRMHKRVRMNDCDDITNNGNLGGRKEVLPEENPKVHDDNGSEGENPTRQMIKRRRKYIDTNEDEDEDEDEDDNDVRGPEGVAYDNTRLTSQDDILKDCHDGVSMPSIADCLKNECYHCSKPIDEPVWRGILNTGNEYILLSGHLSTKSCEKVHDLSKSLARVVEVTKLPRSKVWPKRWEGSKPMDDNIGLYFFPHKMRPDKSHDHLLKEVMENDLALRAIIGDTEMLMFSSSLLPKQYQTFEMKHYLWGVFKPKKVGGKHGVAQHQLDHTNGASAFVASATATEIAIDATRIAPGPTTVATDAATTPSENDTNITTVPANHGRTDSSMGAPPTRMLAFVVKQTPRLEQLIQEMQREGALVMQGEIISDGSWQGNIASVMEGKQPSKT